MGGAGGGDDDASGAANQGCLHLIPIPFGYYRTRVAKGYQTAGTAHVFSLLTYIAAGVVFGVLVPYYYLQEIDNTQTYTVTNAAEYRQYLEDGWECKAMSSWTGTIPPFLDNNAYNFVVRHYYITSAGDIQPTTMRVCANAFNETALTDLTAQSVLPSLRFVYLYLLFSTEPEYASTGYQLYFDNYDTCRRVLYNDSSWEKTKRDRGTYYEIYQSYYKEVRVSSTLTTTSSLTLKRFRLRKMHDYLNQTAYAYTGGGVAAQQIMGAYLGTNCTAQNISETVFGAYKDINLCASFVFLPPYSCTKTEKVRVNTFLGAVGLASSNAMLSMSLLAIPLVMIVDKAELIWKAPAEVVHVHARGGGSSESRIKASNTEMTSFGDLANEQKHGDRGGTMAATRTAV